MTAIWNSLMHVLNTMPPWLASILVGWVISAGITQTVKFRMPLTVHKHLRDAVTRCLAFLSAALPAGLYYATQPDPTPGSALLIMLAAGFWSPIAFSLAQAALRRFWPWAADALSSDKRGVIAETFKPKA